jgi:hypothetical protein
MDFFDSIIAGVAVLALFVSGWALYQVAGAIEYLVRENAANVSLKKLTDLDMELADIRDSMDSFSKSLKLLRSRTIMRENREKERAPDVASLDKDALRAHLSATGRLNPKFHNGG